MADWISVKERLPETKHKRFLSRHTLSDPVYVTVKGTYGNDVCPVPCVYRSDGNWYIDKDSLVLWIRLDVFDVIDGPISEDVVAWMPLLTPFKENRRVS